MLYAISILMAAGVCVNAQVPFSGRCPYQTVEQNFDVKKYTGVWFENRNYFALFQVGGECVSATYSETGSEYIKVVNAAVTAGFPNNISGKAILTDPSAENPEGKLNVSFFGPPEDSPSNYWVLETDYTSYSVVWSCTDRLGALFNTQLLWILTRERFPSQATLDTALNEITSRGLDATQLSITKQTNQCPAPPAQEMISG